MLRRSCVGLVQRGRRRKVLTTIIFKFDNNTTLGWFQDLGKLEKSNLKAYFPGAVIKQNVHKVLHQLALNSVSKISIVPLQDILGLGTNAKMNIPGTTEGNWSWRATREEIPWEMAVELKNINTFFGRNLS